MAPPRIPAVARLDAKKGKGKPDKKAEKAEKAARAAEKKAAGSKAGKGAAKCKKSSHGLVEISLEGGTGAADAAHPPAPKVEAAPVPPPEPVEWFYLDFDNAQQSAGTVGQLRSLYQMGDIHDFTFVWNETMDGWKAVRDCPGLLAGGAAVAAAHGGGLRHAYC